MIIPQDITAGADEDFQTALLMSLNHRDGGRARRFQSELPILRMFLLKNRAHRPLILRWQCSTLLFVHLLREGLDVLSLISSPLASLEET